MIPESLWINSVLAIVSFVFALVLILFFIKIEAKDKEIKLKPKKIIASASKYSVIFGVIFLIIGTIFLIPILFGFESIFLVEQKSLRHETKPPPGLIPNGYLWDSSVPPYILELNNVYFNIRFFGFLSLGILLSLIGILIIFPTIFTRQKKYLELKKFKLNTKKSMTFILIAIFFLFLFGYLTYLNCQDFEWTFNGWNFGGFVFFNSSADSIFFMSLLIAIIVFIPLLIFKIGFLSNSADKSQTIIEENDHIFKEKQNDSSRLEFSKSKYFVIKNYMLPIGFILLILGGCFMELPSRFLIDSYPNFLLENGNVFIEKYYGLIRGQLLLIGIPVLVFGFTLIARYVLEAKEKEPKLGPNKILAFIYKFSMVFGTFFVIVGVLFLATTLIPYGVNIFWFDWYIKNYFWFWHVRLSLFLTGFLFLVIGLFLIIRYTLHKNE